MKKLLLTACLLMYLVSSAQFGLRAPEKEYVALYTHWDWADKYPSDSHKELLKAYGLNYGIELGIMGSVSNLIGMEAKIGYEAFPSLYGGYSAFTGAFGLRLVAGYNEEWNYYVGFRASKVYRTSEVLGRAYRVNPGLELKISRDITDTVFIGLRYCLDNANDQEIFRWSVENRQSVYLTLGIKLAEL